MGNMLNVAVVPIDIAFANPAANLECVGKKLDSIADGTDIIVLPELFSTGYVKDREMLDKLAEDNNGQTITTIRRWASDVNAAIAGSFLAVDDNKFFNRGFFAEPSGEITFYDKKHLFAPGGETKVYSGGATRFFPVRFRGWNVMLFICYDLRFPVWCRNRGLEYDIALFPANWASSREYAFTQLLIARAIENQACVVGANRSGSDTFGDYPVSMSNIYDWFGNPVGKLDNDEIITAVLDRDAMNKFRNRFPVYLDADKFQQ